VPVFPTQKRQQFSPNTLAQHFSALDKDIGQHFKPKSERVTKERRSSKTM
jgi:hypothetical protein